MQTQDRINITIGDEPATVVAPRSLSVFFRAAGGAHPEIGLYTHSHGEVEVDTGLRSGIPAPFQWHNYAVRFNLREKRLTVWSDGICHGTIDRASMARAPEPRRLRLRDSLPWSGQCVTVGGYAWHGNRMVWTDNFRVGARLLATPSKRYPQQKEGRAMTWT